MSLNFQEECERLERDLNNLLAIIHRDGGHHTGEVGTEQSVEDAHQAWGELVLRIAELTLCIEDRERDLAAERERAEKAEAKAEGLRNIINHDTERLQAEREKSAGLEAEIAHLKLVIADEPAYQREEQAQQLQAERERAEKAEASQTAIAWAEQLHRAQIVERELQAEREKSAAWQKLATERGEDKQSLLGCIQYLRQRVQGLVLAWGAAEADLTVAHAVAQARIAELERELLNPDQEQETRDS